MTTFKLISALVILFGGLFGGYLPRLFTNRKNAELLFSYGNAFAGGVFLSVGMIHMLGEAAEQFQDLWPQVDYPFVFVIATASFLILLFIERVTFKQATFDEIQLKAFDADIPESFQHSSFTKNVLFPIILLLTLSVHSLLTGIALGLQSSFSDITILLIAILAHKSTAGFALGVSLERSHLKRKIKVLMILIFAVMTPLGILLGVSFSHLFAMRQREIVEAIFNAAAAGTFLYIAALDIFAEEFIRPQHRWKKFLLTATGFTIMALVAIYT